MKLPALNAVLDKRRMALARARFKAWWEGEEFDAAAAEAALAAVPEAEVSDADLFDAPHVDLPARFTALRSLWGEDRIMPGDETSEALQPARIGVPGDGVLAILGPGHAAPILAVAGAHPGKIAAFEWRDETRTLCETALERAQLGERVSLAPIDLDTMHFVAGVYDGLWSVDDFTYADHASGLGHQIAKALKPGAAAVIETYVAEPDAPLAPSFATAFAEPHLRSHAQLCEIFHDCGLRLEADDDITSEHIALGRQGFKRLEAALASAADGGLDVFALREIAWEAESWRARLRALAQRRLRRFQFVVRKPGADAPPAEALNDFERIQQAIDRAVEDNKND
ncbi:MAG: hypothetical protein GC189_02785 [Alphaproteobacteria bacterium]|nr:hypothetical protein [Alphaproteobacteria bacterium]